MSTPRPSQTSAASTAFCAARVEGPEGHLWVDGNGKITAGNGSLEAPRPNAFSLVQIADCPGSTETCRKTCYVHGLEKHAPDTHALYRHNSENIRRILDDGSQFLWALRMGAWISQNCEGGFRWHVSGDVFSLAYAEWIACVCLNSRNVGHWIYTRSFEFLEPLLQVSSARGGNLALNLSCDRNNYAAADKLAGKHGLRLCYLTADGTVPADVSGGDIIFPDYSLRGGNQAGVDWFASLPAHQKRCVCPVDYHGKSEQRRCGPCDRCLT